MKSFKEHIETQAGDLRLSGEEKRHMRANLVLHMRANPAMRRAVPSPFFSWWRVSQFALAPLAILLLLSGTAYGAQGSLPGDLLYPVKIHVNENVEVALATTPQAKAEVETHLAANRVAEAQTLAAAGRLDATTTQELEDNFDTHASQAIALAELSAKKKPVATTTPPVATSTPRVTSLSAATPTTSPQLASTTQRKGFKSSADSVDDAVSSLKTSLSAQSSVLKALKLRVQNAKGSDAKDTEGAAVEHAQEAAHHPRHSKGDSNNHQ